MSELAFSALINVDLVTTLLGLFVASWAVGYGTGYVMMLVRRYSHTVVD